MTVIGKGLAALKEFVEKCLSVGGVPIFRAQFAGRPFKDKLVVSCYGAAYKVRGGVIEDLPPDLVEKIRMARGRDWEVVIEELKARGYTITAV